MSTFKGTAQETTENKHSNQIARKKAKAIFHNIICRCIHCFKCNIHWCGRVLFKAINVNDLREAQLNEHNLQGGNCLPLGSFN